MDAPVYLSYTRNFGAPRRPQADFFLFLHHLALLSKKNRFMHFSKDFYIL